MSKRKPFFTHPDYTGFMKGVCSAPDDVTAQLVLADWLEDYEGKDKEAARRKAKVIRLHNDLTEILERRRRFGQSERGTLLMPEWVADFKEVSRQLGLLMKDFPLHETVGVEKWAWDRIYYRFDAVTSGSFVTAVSLSAQDWLRYWWGMTWREGWGCEHDLAEIAQPITEVAIREFITFHDLIARPPGTDMDGFIQGTKRLSKAWMKIGAPTGFHDYAPTVEPLYKETVKKTFEEAWPGINFKMDWNLPEPDVYDDQDE